MSTVGGQDIALIARRLRDERERLRLSQQQMASLTGRSKRSQVGYEAGDNEPVATYFAAAAALGVDVRYVLTGVRTPMAELTDEQQGTLGIQRKGYGEVPGSKPVGIHEPAAAYADRYRDALSLVETVMQLTGMQPNPVLYEALKTLAASGATAEQLTLLVNGIKQQINEGAK